MFPSPNQEQDKDVSLLLSTLYWMEVLPGTVRWEKEIKSGHIAEEELSYLYLQMNMILYIENSRESTEKLIELSNEFIKVKGYKINMHFYTQNQWTIGKLNWEHNSIYHGIEKNKLLRNTFNNKSATLIHWKLQHTVEIF